MTLAEIQAKRDEILRDIELASVRFADGRQKDWVADKQKALSLLDAEAARLSRRSMTTLITHSKG